MNDVFGPIAVTSWWRQKCLIIYVEVEWTAGHNENSPNWVQTWNKFT